MTTKKPQCFDVYCETITDSYIRLMYRKTGSSENHDVVVT